MKKILIALIAVLSLGNLVAQETTSNVRGTVTDGAGNAVANAVVTVTSSTTGVAKSDSTDVNGLYSIRNLPSGVTYQVVVTADGLLSSESDGLNLAVGQTAVLNIALSTLEEVTVLGQRVEVASTALGPNAVFSLEDLQTSPAVNRNINDVIGQDPRVFIEQNRGDIDAIQCVGANSRFNSLTVDGIRLNDGFGLNSNGYPTQRMPFPYDAVSSVAVEMAPMSVTYGGFSACNINAVTKSGSNEMFGSGFLELGGSDLQGSSIEGDDLNLAAYDESVFGFEFGGALIQDKLFFYGAYEFYDTVNFTGRGPVGSGALREVDITQAELDRIIDIAVNKYGFNPGEIPQDPFDTEDEKYLLKLDYYADDRTRLSFTYQYNEGLDYTASDGGSDELEFAGHYYLRGAEMNAYSFSAFTDWTENLSPELRYAVNDVDFTHTPSGGLVFGEFRVETDEVDVYFGADDSRQANDLDYTVTNFVFKSSLVVDNHTFTFGFENENYDVYNLFYQHTLTETRFRSIDDFEAGIGRVYYGNHFSHNQDLVGDYLDYDVGTLYLMDEFSVNDKLNVVLGLRYEYYETDSIPQLNTNFVDAFGFANNTTLDGVDLLMPRLGFTYELSDSVELRGGYGLFSGGNPNVWYMNNYANTNVDAVQTNRRGMRLFEIDYAAESCVAGAPRVGAGYCVPQALYDEITNLDGSNFEINYLDPNFKAPSELKTTFGVTKYYDDGTVVTLDYQKGKGQDNAIWKRGPEIVVDGTTDQGRDAYDQVGPGTFVLTNASVGNTSESIALGVYKDFGDVDVRLGYAYVDSKDVNPMTSSVGASNYWNRAFWSPQEEVLARSNYNVRNRLTARVGYVKEFFAGLPTRFVLFAQADTGSPYSLVIDGYDCTVREYGYTPYLDFGNHCLVEPGTRNAEDGSDFAKADLRITQALPTLRDGDRASAYFVIDNFTNFLNDEWGVLRRAGFPYGVTPSRVSSPEFTSTGASLWEMRIGFDYKF
jgi:hypothetical protein